MTSQDIKLSIQNPASSYWLKNAVKSQDKRDIVDALRDSHILDLFLKAKAKEMGLPV